MTVWVKLKFKSATNNKVLNNFPEKRNLFANFCPWGMSIVHGLIVTISNVNDPRRIVSLVGYICLSFCQQCYFMIWIFHFSFSQFYLFSADMLSIGCSCLLANLLLHTFFRHVVTYVVTFYLFLLCKFVDTRYSMQRLWNHNFLFVFYS